jgi:hypothetical protein
VLRGIDTDSLIRAAMIDEVCLSVSFRYSITAESAGRFMMPVSIFFPSYSSVCGFPRLRERME